MKLSIVSPVFLAGEIVEELVSRIIKEIGPITNSYEIILIDDGSPDNSWQIIKQEALKNENIAGIQLSRNFGQHYAITAGLELSSGEIVVVMDCDLQDDPSIIRQLLQEHEKGADIVFTKRKNRSHNQFKKITGLLYRLMIKIFSDKNYDVDLGSIFSAKRKAVDAVLKMKDQDRLFIQMFKWIGFNQSIILVAHEKRFAGKSSYSFRKMLKLALQGLTSHSNKLLLLSVYIGFAIASVSFFLALLIVILYFTKGFLPGWPSLFVGLALATGLILMSNGVLGIYLGKTFNQVKSRPLYLIKETLNVKKNE